MSGRYLSALLFGLTLSACSSGHPDEFPRSGNYGVVFDDSTGDKEMADIYIDASTQEKLADFLAKKVSDCDGYKPTASNGKIEGQTTCKMLGRDFAVTMSGSYTSSSIDFVTSTEGGSLGPLVEKHHYRLREKKAG